jgi:hypothetical protein
MSPPILAMDEQEYYNLLSSSYKIYGNCSTEQLGERETVLKSFVNAMTSS